jgi:hypothetical protein
MAQQVIGSQHLTLFLAAEYIAIYMEQHYNLKSKATGCQVYFLQLSVKPFEENSSAEYQ